MRRFASASAMLAVSLLICGAALAASSTSSPSPANAVAKRHMIVAAEPDASEAGRLMLREGGSAVDAAIAAQMVLTLVEPQSSGIGGGSYLVVSDGASLHAYDGRETGPGLRAPSDVSRRPRTAAARRRRHSRWIVGRRARHGCGARDGAQGARTSAVGASVRACDPPCRARLRRSAPPRA